MATGQNYTKDGWEIPMVNRRWLSILNFYSVIRSAGCIGGILCGILLVGKMANKALSPGIQKTDTGYQVSISSTVPDYSTCRTCLNTWLKTRPAIAIFSFRLFSAS